MALSAKMVEIVGHMVRVRDILIICLVASIAFHRGILISGAMAGDAGKRDMRPR
jgi:hypothetical protein